MLINHHPLQSTTNLLRVTPYMYTPQAAAGTFMPAFMCTEALSVARPRHHSDLHMNSSEQTEGRGPCVV